MVEKTKAFEHGVDSEGRFYRGCVAVLDSGDQTVALVCPNMDKLRRAWKRLARGVPLDISAVQYVRMHEDDD